MLNLTLAATGRLPAFYRGVVGIAVPPAQAGVACCCQRALCDESCRRIAHIERTGRVGWLVEGMPWSPALGVRWQTLFVCPNRVTSNLEPAPQTLIPTLTLRAYL